MSELEYKKQDSHLTLYNCYSAMDYDNDIEIIISKDHPWRWVAGIYRDKVDWHPHISRNGFVGTFDSLKQAKKTIEAIIKDGCIKWFLNRKYHKGGK